MTPKRYDIYLADLDPSIGSEISKISKIRPVVVISQNAMNRNLETIVVCPLTSKLHPSWRSRLQIDCAGKTAEIAIDQIRTISQQRLQQKIDRLSDESAAQLRQLIVEMYGS